MEYIQTVPIQRFDRPNRKTQVAILLSNLLLLGWEDAKKIVMRSDQAVMKNLPKCLPDCFAENQAMACFNELKSCFEESAWKEFLKHLEAVRFRPRTSNCKKYRKRCSKNNFGVRVASTYSILLALRAGILKQSFVNSIYVWWRTRN